MELKDDETFQTDFIGASVQECQEWALEKQHEFNLIEQNIIAIADARSARDDTLSIQWYQPYVSPVDPEEEYSRLEPEQETWYDLRVNYEGSSMVITRLAFGPLDGVHDHYFGHKEELTDERGVFYVDKAERIMYGEDSLDMP